MRDTSRPAVTLEHVARAAGVSRATASRVLAESGPVSAPARRAVRAAADRLGYVADPVARALVSGTGTRLVVAVTGASPAVLDDPYVGRALTAAARVCTGQGLGVALQWLPLDDPTAALATLAGDRTVGGVVLINTTRSLLAALPPALRPRVASVGVGAPGIPAVDVDSGRSATATVEHLLRSGRRRIAMITGPPWLPCARRPVAAYGAAMAAAGLPAHTVTGDFNSAAGEAAAREALRRWPDTDAVLAISDAAALGALGALRARGRQVPDDVAVTGFGDIPAAEHSGPPLTTATHPVEEIVAAATAAALAPRAAEGERWFRSHLVLRDSA